MTKLSWRLVAAVAALALAGGAIAGGRHVLGFDAPVDVQALMRSGLPDDTLVYDRTGTVLLADLKQTGTQHTDVSLAAMGRWLPAATVADQDPGFWSEPGVDAGRLARAAWDGVRGQTGETGSSIVLRLIRLRLGSPVGVVARARALALAVRVAGAVPKASILESYLNSLPYGNRAAGVEGAAITYFQVDASQLDLAQASLLAGLPDAPADLDPLQHLPLAKRRQRQVLDAMVRAGVIGLREADQAYGEPLQLVGPTSLDVAPDIVSQVLTELQTRYGSDAFSRGFTVVTTLDWGLQQEAERVVHVALAANRSRNMMDAALAAVDPRTGQILALVALDAGDVRFALATKVPLDPGNAFRVFTYTAAIASGRYTMVTPVSDAPLSVDASAGPGSYQIQDYDGRNRAPCQLRDCLGGGLNIPAVLVQAVTGVPAVAQTAQALGAPTPTPAPTEGLPLTLGGIHVTPLQMAASMGTLAAGGVRRQPEAILRLSTAGGSIVSDGMADPGSQALDPGAAFIVSQMLADDSSRAEVYGTGSPLVLPGRHAAAAAGTSADLSDGWTVGYTPSLAAAVWLGDLYLQPRPVGADGMIVAGPAWHQFMQAALDQMDRGDEWYTPPPGVQETTVDGRPAWFLPGTSAAMPAPALPPGVHAG
jgi:membrane peptidoglycan carboxypeptidase